MRLYISLGDTKTERPNRIENIERGFNDMKREVVVTVHDAKDRDIVEKATDALSEMYGRDDLKFNLEGTQIAGRAHTKVVARGEHFRLGDFDFIHGLSMFVCGHVAGYKQGRMSDVQAA